jgi:hypothetical protein
MTIVATDNFGKSIAVQLAELNDQTARLMGFKKVHYFMGKLCVQIEGDVPNNNIPWAPTTNANDAMQIMNKYRFILKPEYHLTSDGADTFPLWMCGSEHCDEYDTDPLIAICKSLIRHAKLG